MVPRGDASFWANVRAAIRGGDHDYTQAPLSRAILLLAIPMVLEMCMESLFGIVDIFWVARLGSHAAAGVGITESLMSILYSIAMGVSMATTAMIARRTGEKNSGGASNAASGSATAAPPASSTGCKEKESLARLTGHAPATSSAAPTGWMRPAIRVCADA